MISLFASTTTTTAVYKPSMERFVQGFFSVAHGHTAQAKIDLTCMTRVVGAEQSVCRRGPGKGDKRFFLYTGSGTRLLGGNATVIGARRCRVGGTWQLSRLPQLGLTHTERCLLLFLLLLVLLLFCIRGDCSSSPACGGKRGVCIVRRAFHLVQIILLTMCGAVQ